MCNAFLDIFMSKKQGKIINTASIAGYSPSPLMPHYNASKAAAISFSQGLSMELGPYNVNVNIVNPGFVYTPIYEERGLQIKNARPGFEDCKSSEEVMNNWQARLHLDVRKALKYS
jgi:short-subunit dehydrogenase